MIARIVFVAALASTAAPVVVDGAIAQSACGGSAAERATTISHLLDTGGDWTPGPVSEVKYADFTNYGPGLLIAVTDSALTMADSVSQVAAALPVAVYALKHMRQAEQCHVIIVGWRRQMTRNSHFTRHVPFLTGDLLRPAP